MIRNIVPEPQPLKLSDIPNSDHDDNLRLRFRDNKSKSSGVLATLMDIELENIGLDFLAEFAQSTPETSFNNSSISLDIKGSFVETPTKNHKKCIHCSKKYKNTTSTTNLKRHLGLSHPNIISETSITTPDVMPGIRKPTIQENLKLNMLILKYLILTNISCRL
ncbi:unnamed protein product [Gordionus sp. m RMFG-2023]